MGTEIKRATMTARNIQLRRARPMIGGLICGVAALGVSGIASGHSWQTDVPLGFSVVLLAVAFVFGTRAGIVGSLLAAVVFASFLFSPVRSMHVASQAARSNLGWMLLIGVSFSLLFAPPSSGLDRR
jgi:K+-sensing histidine kinase KdpD